MDFEGCVGVHRRLKRGYGHLGENSRSHVWHYEEPGEECTVCPGQRAGCAGGGAGEGSVFRAWNVTLQYLDFPKESIPNGA